MSNLEKNSKLQNFWLAHASRDFALLGIIFCLNVLLKILIKIVQVALHPLVTLSQSEALAPSDWLSYSMSNAVANAISAFLWLDKAMLALFWLGIGMEVIAFLLAKKRRIKVFKSIKLTRRLQKYLLGAVEDVDYSNIDWLSKALRTSKRAQKSAKNSIRQAIVVIGKESYIIIPKPDNYKAQKMIGSAIVDSINVIVAFAGKNNAAEERLDTNHNLYWYYQLN